MNIQTSRLALRSDDQNIPPYTAAEILPSIPRHLRQLLRILWIKSRALELHWLTKEGLTEFLFFCDNSPLIKKSPQKGTCSLIRDSEFEKLEYPIDTGGNWIHARIQAVFSDGNYLTVESVVYDSESKHHQDPS